MLVPFPTPQDRVGRATERLERATERLKLLLEALLALTEPAPARCSQQALRVVSSTASPLRPDRARHP
jgi:hypothetical protein